MALPAPPSIAMDGYLADSRAVALPIECGGKMSQISEKYVLFFLSMME